ncbi:MAG TPA: hypothetical protein VGV88_11555 [Candidatus Dormibacteraeota bacterium]|nr:hypothetical protein [Candidatus Dormibacteraeota bacterium]
MPETEPKPRALEAVSPGSGQGFKAVLRNGNQVVVHEIPVAPAAAAAATQRIQRLTEHPHPSLSPVHAWGTEEGGIWVAVDVNEGTPLNIVLARGRLSPHAAAALGTSILSGIAALHEAGVAMGGFDATAVRLTSNGVVRIAGHPVAAVRGAPSQSDLRADVRSCGMAICAAFGVDPAGAPAPPELPPGLVVTMRSIASGAMGPAVDRALGALREMAGPLMAPDKQTAAQSEIALRAGGREMPSAAAFVPGGEAPPPRPASYEPPPRSVETYGSLPVPRPAETFSPPASYERAAASAPAAPPSGPTAPPELPATPATPPVPDAPLPWEPAAAAPAAPFESMPATEQPVVEPQPVPAPPSESAFEAPSAPVVPSWEPAPAGPSTEPAAAEAPAAEVAAFGSPTSSTPPEPAQPELDWPAPGQPEPPKPAPAATPEGPAVWSPVQTGQWTPGKSHVSASEWTGEATPVPSPVPEEFRAPTPASSSFTTEPAAEPARITRPPIPRATAPPPARKAAAAGRPAFGLAFERPAWLVPGAIAAIVILLLGTGGIYLFTHLGNASVGHTGTASPSAKPKSSPSPSTAGLLPIPDFGPQANPPLTAVKFCTPAAPCVFGGGVPPAQDTNCTLGGACHVDIAATWSGNTVTTLTFTVEFFDRCNNPSNATTEVFKRTDQGVARFRPTYDPAPAGGFPLTLPPGAKAAALVLVADTGSVKAASAPLLLGASSCA